MRTTHGCKGETINVKRVMLNVTGVWETRSRTVRLELVRFGHEIRKYAIDYDFKMKSVR